MNEFHYYEIHYYEIHEKNYDYWNVHPRHDHHGRKELNLQ
jgi:hypothetical protein